MAASNAMAEAEAQMGIQRALQAKNAEMQAQRLALEAQIAAMDDEEMDEPELVAIENAALKHAEGRPQRMQAELERAMMLDAGAFAPGMRAQLLKRGMKKEKKVFSPRSCKMKTKAKAQQVRASKNAQKAKDFAKVSSKHRSDKITQMRHMHKGRQ